jgi:hypothetical protein
MNEAAKQAAWERCLAWQSKIVEKMPIESKTEIINNYNLNKNINYKNYKGLYLRINTDPIFVKAQGWGMAGGLLYNLCKKFGESFVKGRIEYISGWHDNAFTLPEPKHLQRGKVCKKDIETKGALRNGQKNTAS